MQLLSNQGVSCRNIGHEQLRVTQSCGNSSTAPTLVPICREIRHVTFTRFLVPISVAEGPHFTQNEVPIWSPFEKFRSPFHVGAVLSPMVTFLSCSTARTSATLRVAFSPPCPFQWPMVCIQTFFTLRVFIHISGSLISGFW